MNRPDDLVSASEIASWAWCPESWRLGKLGAEPSNRAEMVRGETLHADKADVEQSSRSALAFGRLLLFWAVLLAAAAFGLAVLQ
ncbi:hypothetical protein [Paludisphaera rhizosphaerae]|uniref:hypothetical protein n=1 Tax=Paludisphaera rhizosphaerae TaxID=2711216 RepID=UPI0013EA9625|nr:hypothetical protein [Paludisphaera rhizosphaerae]